MSTAIQHKGTYYLSLNHLANVRDFDEPLMTGALGLRVFYQPAAVETGGKRFHDFRSRQRGCIETVSDDDGSNFVLTSEALACCRQQRLTHRQRI